MKFTLSVIAGVLAATSGLAIQVNMYDGNSGSGGRNTVNVNPNQCKDIDNSFGGKMQSFTKDPNSKCTFYPSKGCKGSGKRYDQRQAMFCFVPGFSNRARSLRCS